MYSNIYSTSKAYGASFENQTRIVVTKSRYCNVLISNFKCNLALIFQRNQCLTFGSSWRLRRLQVFPHSTLFLASTSKPNVVIIYSFSFLFLVQYLKLFCVHFIFYYTFNLLFMKGNRECSSISAVFEIHYHYILYKYWNFYMDIYIVYCMIC